MSNQRRIVSPDSPRIGVRQTVYEDKYQLIYRATVDFGDFTKEYFVREAGERAGIVAVRGGSVLLVKQYRFLINRPSLEVPGGGVDDGEPPEETAVRECLEETGVRCINPRPLIFYHAGLDTTHNPTHIFYSDEVAEAPEPQSIHATEVSGHEWVPLTQCIEMIHDGQIMDAFSIIALLAYRSLAAYQLP